MTTRDRLVKSAQELLWERGYVGMSPKAIQERSGAGQGSMYHHFDGKADLALAAIQKSANEFKEGAERCLKAAGTPMHRLRGYMLRSRQILKGCQLGKLTQDPEIINNELLRRPIGETLLWLQAQLQSLLEQAIESGELAATTDALEVAAMLVASIQGGYVLAAAAGSAEPFHRAVRGALAILHLGSVKPTRHGKRPRIESVR